MNYSLAALLGNGVSIAYNEALRLDRINAEISRRINGEVATSGTQPIKLLQAAARRIDTGDPTTDFEALFGPFAQYRDGIELVRDLAALTGDDNRFLRNALSISADYIERIRRKGVGYVLEVIAQHSRSVIDGRPEVRDLINALVTAAGAGLLTIGNLNYDSLVMAALCNSHGSSFCDMTDGRLATQYTDINNHMLEGRPLRISASFPTDRTIRLLHLHGSLCWLRAPGPDGRVFRFDAAGMRNAEYWRAYREKLTDWTPEVVLTNQASKSQEVKRYPFKLAYDCFYERLVKADRWFIGGYSFRDECVNELLANAWRSRKQTPMIFVVTYGKQPTRQAIFDALGWSDWSEPKPQDSLIINRLGFPAVYQETDWKWFADMPRLLAAG